MGVDGTHIRFTEQPRKIPRHHFHKSYTNRKFYYSLNAMVVANKERIIHVDYGWPRSTHDARVMRLSRFKDLVESQNNYCMLGDSGYAIS